MGFFVHSNTSEILVINLRGQNSLKNQEMSKIAIAIYLIVYVAYILKLKIGSSHGIVVSTKGFKSIDCRFESMSGVLFTLFFSS